MRTLVDEVKDRLDIVEVVAGYVKMTPAGTNFRGLCPFHREKTPSFMVSREKQIFHCFGCGKGGDVITFIEEIEGVEFKEALKILAERAGLDYLKYQGISGQGGNADQKERVRLILEKTADFYGKNLLALPGKEALDYLKSRGISDESIRIFRLGYAPKRNENGAPSALFDYLRKLGFLPADIVASGSVYKKDNLDVYVDRFRDRVVFPVSDSLGRIAGFSARILPGDTSGQGKYINTPQTDYYDKSSLLYGFFQAKTAIRENGQVVMLEGNLDVVLSHQAGVKQAVATCGTALGARQLKILRHYTDNLIMAFDADVAGIKATKKAAELAWMQEFDTKIIPIEAGKDVADIVREDPKKWVSLVKKRKSVAGFFYGLAFGKRKLNLQQKKIITEKLLKIYSLLPSRVEQSYYLRKLAEKVKVPENYLWEKIDSLKGRERTNNYLKKAQEPENHDSAHRVSRRTLLEERIMGIIYGYPRFYYQYFDELTCVEFEDPAMKKIFEEISAYLNGFSENEGSKAKIKNLEFSSRNLELKASEIALKTERELGEDFWDDIEKVQKEFVNTIRSTQKEILSEKRKDILSKIKLAEKNKDVSQVDELMKELQSMSQEMVKE